MYCSQVATLLTPDLWSLVGRTPPLDVPTGDSLAVAEVAKATVANLPESLRNARHLAMIGRVVDPADPDPEPLRSGAWFDFDRFRDYLRRTNDVAFRNLHLVGDLRRKRSAATLPFWITGAADRLRVFDFEVVLRMPAGIDVSLVVPGGLGPAFGATPQLPAPTSPLALRSLARLQRHWFCDVRLGRQARHPAELRLAPIPGTVVSSLSGYSVAIRQLYRGEEVGRITWHWVR